MYNPGNVDGHVTDSVRVAGWAISPNIDDTPDTNNKASNLSCVRDPNPLLPNGLKTSGTTALRESC